jgi:glutamate-1-semialdehyde 2,1-aminomutase
VSSSRYEESERFLIRAEKSIPLGSQTFSKSRTQYPIGISPFFIDKAKGSYVWDIDGNRYVDLVNSLACITLGYSDPRIIRDVKYQLKKGTIFSLPGTLEAEVAELIIDMVPSAEMVRFGKNGSDATSAAVRLARAYTGRDEIAYCGYHGWQDWFIGATTRNKGVPTAVIELIHSFEFNNLDSLKKIFANKPKKIAAVIMEPMASVYPEPDFLQEVKKLAHDNGALLIFDETITGFRFAKGGAQEEFGVTPDLSTLGKGMANGFPLSAVVGKKEIMMEMENIFFSGTFGGELLSLAAAKSVLKMHQEGDITGKLAKIGTNIQTGVEKCIEAANLNQVLRLEGHPTWKFLKWDSINGLEVNVIKTFFMQEMLSRGVLILGTHNVSCSIRKKHIAKVVNTYSEVLGELALGLKSNKLEELLIAKPLKPLFSIR